MFEMRQFVTADRDDFALLEPRQQAVGEDHARSTTRWQRDRIGNGPALQLNLLEAWQTRGTRLRHCEESLEQFRIWNGPRSEEQSDAIRVPVIPNEEDDRQGGGNDPFALSGITGDGW